MYSFRTVQTAVMPTLKAISPYFCAYLGIALILLHHFSPAFLMGGSTYKANRPRPL